MMGAAVNHIISLLVNPYLIAIAGLLLGEMLRFHKHKKTGLAILGGSALWLYVWSINAWVGYLGYCLEMEYPPVEVTQIEKADLICVLGGGMQVKKRNHPFVEMNSGADRVWRGAQLYLAGIAPRVLVSGPGVADSTIPLLEAFGVPREHILVDETPENTEEEGFAIRNRGAAKVVLVTSAWHMKRAKMLLANAGVCVIPAACDYEYSHTWSDRKLGIYDFVPNAGALASGCVVFKEYFAYFCYKRLKYH